MAGDYIKIFRKMLNWGWYTDSNTKSVFLHALLKCNYAEGEYKGYQLKPGQCIFGRKKWAQELGLSEQQVRTAIEHLKSTNEITTKSTNRFTVITIEKWGFWQMDEGEATNDSTNKATNKQPTDNQQATNKQPRTKKERNKEGKKARTYIRDNPPSLEEIKQYVSDKNLNVDPEFFYTCFSESDWVDSKGDPVKSWKQKLLTWHKRETDNNDNRRASERSRYRDGQYGREARPADRGNRDKDSDSGWIQEYITAIEKDIEDTARNPDPFGVFGDSQC